MAVGKKRGTPISACLYEMCAGLFLHGLQALGEHGDDLVEVAHDVVGTCQLAHGHDVLHHLVGLHPVGVVRHVVGAGHDDHCLGVQVDDVGREACQHLCRRLSADASAAEVVLLEELGVVECPVFRDGVAHEHHFGEFAAGDDAFVVGLVAVEAEPILLSEA